MKNPLIDLGAFVGGMQPGTFDLVGTIIYEIDQHPYQNTFYNGTIEVVEAGGFLSIESVFLVTLGIALLVLLVLWIHGQIQHLSKVLIVQPNFHFDKLGRMFSRHFSHTFLFEEGSISTKESSIPIQTERCQDY